MCGLTAFGANIGTCGLDYQWDYNNNISGSFEYINVYKSQPSSNSSANCG